ncbi:MAG: ribosome silencing factor [Pseudomonadota bacterium]
MELESLRDLIVAALEELKGVNVQALDVRGRCSFTDLMIFASGTSDRHVKSLAANVEDKVRAAGVRPLGVEGDDQAQANWVLLDLGEAVVHVMLAETREYYQLERLWAMGGEHARNV